LNVTSIGGSPPYGIGILEFNVPLDTVLVISETGTPPYSTWEVSVSGRLCNGNNFATSAALAEVCALLSAVLVHLSAL